MNLRNYDNVMAAKQLCTNRASCISMGEHTNFCDGHLSVKDTGGNIRQIYGGYSSSWVNPNPFQDTYDYNSGLICGSDDTPVTYDDYKLGAQFTSAEVSLVGTEFSDTTYDEATNTFKRTMKKVFSAKKDLTIKEIGFSVYVPAYKGTTDTNGSNYLHLMYRKVLDEPISVEANSNFELTFTTVVSACANKPAEYEASVTTE